ncbi:MAG: hypothetical protein J7502_04525, partial [Flavisolibacter sp.]|nr:hypothetical protein [Flavisolibacter sp.]
NKAGQLKLEVHDIFNQNQSVNRSIFENGFQDTRTNVIRRYFMLSFTYSLNRTGGRNLNRAGGRNMQFNSRGLRESPPPPPGRY